VIDTSQFELPKPFSGEKMNKYQRTKQRKRLWEKREHVCYLCGFGIMDFDDMELDHRKPGKMGGCKDDTDENQELTHRKCNREKGSRRG
jgi:5-methylcytosine-specific restriction endonuclease McrA